MNENLSRLRILIADAMDIDEEEITSEAHFINDIGVDSLISLEVLVRLEKEFNIKIPESDLTRMVSLNEIYNLLEEKGVL